MDKQTETMSSFSDLPQEILSDISHRLGLIDLLSFRGVCRSTRSASFNSSAAIESSSECLCWFLLYGDDDSPHCSIIVPMHDNDLSRRYNIHLPEIADSTCVASLNGWLLFLSSDSSMFFFCPFSRAKINLPTNCPFDLHDFHFAAAFSHPPTHTDCSVVVLRRNSDNYLQLCLLGRGDSEWCWYQYNCPISDFKKTMSVIHYRGAFHFLDDIGRVVFFDDKLKDSWSKGFIVGPPTDEYGEDGVIFNMIKQELSCSITMGTSKAMKSVLGIEEACFISVCGTLISITDYGFGHVYHLVPHELIDGTEDDDTDRRQLKGVWIHPRFHQISPDQSW